MNRALAEEILQIANAGITSYTRNDLKRIYRQLAKRFHPDFCATNTAIDQQNAAQHMARINEAYDYLTSCFDQLNDESAHITVNQSNAWVKDRSGWAHSTADNSVRTAEAYTNNDASTSWKRTSPNAQTSFNREPSHAAHQSAHTPHQGTQASVSEAWRGMGAYTERSTTAEHKDRSTHNTAQNTSDTQAKRRTTVKKARRYTHYTDAYASSPQVKAAAFARELMSEKHREARRVIADAAKTPQPTGKHPLRRFTTKPVAQAFWQITPMRLKVYCTLVICSMLVFITALVAGLTLHLPSAYMGLVALLLLLVIFCLTPKPSGIITRMIVRHDQHKAMRRAGSQDDDSDVIEGDVRTDFRP